MLALVNGNCFEIEMFFIGQFSGPDVDRCVSGMVLCAYFLLLPSKVHFESYLNIVAAACCALMISFIFFSLSSENRIAPSFPLLCS